HVGDVRQPHARRQQVVVGELALIAGGDELGRGPRGDPPGRAEVALGRLGHSSPPSPSIPAATAVAPPPVCQNTTGPSSSRARSTSAAIAFAVKTGSSTSP